MTKASRAVLKFVPSAVLMAVVALGLATSPAWSQSASSSSSSDDSTDTTIAFMRTYPNAAINNFNQIGIISNTVRERRSGAAGSAKISSISQTGLAGAAGDSRWSTWAALSANNVAYSFRPLSSAGNANGGLLGVDYSLENGAVVGVALGSDSSRMTTFFNGGNVSTTGYNVAPYIMVPINANWTFDGSFGLGNGKIKSNLGGGVTGNTTDRRSFGSLALTYATAIGNWQVQSTGSLLASSNSMQSFRLSNALFVPSSTNGLTQLRVGGRATYGSGMFVPSVGMTFVQDLSRTEVLPIAGQTPLNSRAAVILQAGVNINAGNPISGSVQLSSELREQVRNNGVVATVSFRF